ncbi:MAG: hypothetical protein ACYSU8_06585 [Planctomycetota bacterium]|jgi:hypothetical protein
MKPLNQTEDRIRQTKPDIETPAAMDSRILMDSYAAMGSHDSTEKPSGHYKLRRILMKNTLKYTAAAVILIAATLSLTLFDTTVPSAYALDQTIEVLNAMRSIHVRMYYPSFEEPILVWAQFHENGQIKALRVSQSKLAAGDPHDGPKEAVLKNNTAQLWLKEKNMIYHINEQEKAAEIGAFFQKVDPKLIVKKLEQMQQEGTAQIEIDQPDQIDQPITITATLIEEDPLFGHQVVALVDQATKLVISLETLKGDGKFDPKTDHFGMEDFSQLEFFDYNQSFAEDIFTLNVPDDVMVVDQATRKVGLSLGNMSIEEMAVEVVRRFLQSILDEDYETAGLMYGGVPAEKIKESLGKQPEGEILRVLSIGTAKIHPNPDYENKAFVVPCTLEYVKNGQIEQKTFNCVVREVDGQPGQWAICGGI